MKPVQPGCSKLHVAFCDRCKGPYASRTVVPAVQTQMMDYAGSKGATVSFFWEGNHKIHACAISPCLHLNSIGHLKVAELIALKIHRAPSPKHTREIPEYLKCLICSSLRRHVICVRDFSLIWNLSCDCEI